VYFETDQQQLAQVVSVMSVAVVCLLVVQPEPPFLYSEQVR
jgi:hypothetical protein